METESTVVKREVSEPDPARLNLVSQLTEMVQADKKYWKSTFDKMKRNRRFARGMQWTDQRTEVVSEDTRYVANITHSHIKHRTATIYARNPRFQFRQAKRLKYQYWDGTAQHLQTSMMAMQSGADLLGQAQMVVHEALSWKQKNEITRKTGETLSILYEYFVKEQVHPTKTQMKKMVGTAITTGVGYVKQVFQRTLGRTPEQEQALSDHRSLLEQAERISADLADGEIDHSDGEVERLKQIIAQLENQPQIVIREGLAISYPSPTSIIPDKHMTWLPEFIGCDHVSEEFVLTPQRVQEVYGVDIRSKFTAYSRGSDDNHRRSDAEQSELACVYEIWSKSDNMIYVICEGYPDFLVEPAAPPVYTERFWPFFVYAPNADDDDELPYPPSDVDLMYAQQMEVNYIGDAIRDHRKAARPRHVSGSDINDNERQTLQNAAAHSITVLDGLGPDEDIRKRFQAFPTINIDPNLYSTVPVFTDVQRVLGTQEANFGGTSGDTATEASIAEGSRQARADSAIDDLDDMLNNMARAGGQILMQEMSREKVMEIVGPAAIWPDQTIAQIAQEIYLECEAGSSGKPNVAQKVQVRERMYPLMFQLPGIKQEWLLKDMLKTLDDTIQYEDAIDLGAMSIIAMNGMMQASANNGSLDGQDQGAEGGSNAPAPPSPGNEGPARPGQPGFGSLPQE